MVDALTAETMKLVRHRATWGLVWIFPLGLTVLFLGALAWQLGHRPPAHFVLPNTAASWIENTLTGWKAARSGPARCLVGAFAALAFGGEYGWNTWKLVVPHRSRLSLIAAKYVVVVGLLMTAFVLMAALDVAFSVAPSPWRGPLPGGISVGALFAAHGRDALATLLSTLLSVGYGSAAAILFRSGMGGTITSVVAVIAEGLVMPFAPLLNRSLFLALPTYHLNNLTDWITTGRPLLMPLPSGLLHWDWIQSLAVLALWILGLMAVSTVAFQRQDLN
jgi:ABC-type transport system involved in multi-copper enzyme maturation permease subunit